VNHPYILPIKTGLILGHKQTEGEIVPNYALSFTKKSYWLNWVILNYKMLLKSPFRARKTFYCMRKNIKLISKLHFFVSCPCPVSVSLSLQSPVNLQITTRLHMGFALRTGTGFPLYSPTSIISPLFHANISFICHRCRFIWKPSFVNKTLLILILSLSLCLSTCRQGCGAWHVTRAAIRRRYEKTVQLKRL